VKTTYVALMRGINVGGKNRITMADLSAVFAAAKCADVRTYIQSGNVVLSAEAGVAGGLAAAVAKRLEKDFALKTPVVLRAASELAEVARKNPFAGRSEWENASHVMFLADAPAEAAIAALDAKRSPGDEFRVVGRDIYLWCPKGVGNTKLTNAYFDSKLKTVSTGRNWRTVLALLEMTKA
jgi:uncharacterized protein (DUF1697 family)